MLADSAEEAARKRVRRRGLVVACMVALGMLLGALIPLFQPRPYRASCRLQMFLRSAPSNRQGRLSKQGVADQRELMLGRTFLEEVVSRLSPEDREQLFGRNSIRPGKHAQSQEAQRASAALAPLTIDIDPLTQMMEISFPSQKPHLALAVVKAAVSAADDVGLRLRLEQTTRVSVALRERLDALEQEIQQAEMRQEADEKKLGQAQGLLGKGRSGSTASSEASMSREARKLARRTRRSSSRLESSVAEEEAPEDPMLEALGTALTHESLVRRLSDARANAFVALAANGQDAALESQAQGPDKDEIDRLRSTLDQQSMQASALAQQLGPSQPLLLSARAAEQETANQLQQADRHLVDTAQTEAAIAKTREAKLTGEFNREKRIAGVEASARFQDQMPELDLAIDEDLDAVQTQILRSAQVDAALKAFGFYVVDEPSVPREREPWQFRRSLQLGTSAGIAAGLFLAFILYWFEVQIWNPADAERESGLSLVAVLPRLRKSRKIRHHTHDRPEVMEDPHGLYTSALQELADKVLSQSADTPIPAILLTSATPGEGKSTTAANLAVVLAGQGVRVLLVDADLHRPTQHRRFGVSMATGLSGVLSGRTELRDAIRPLAAMPGLDVLVAGPSHPQASQLIQSGALESLLQQVRNLPRSERYQLLIVDAPPALDSSDSAYLARCCDVLLFVARFGQVDLRRIRRGARLLAVTAPPISGLVVNAIPVRT